MTRREYSRANGRNEGVDLDEKRRVRPLIWRAIRCLIVVAKSVARDCGRILEKGFFFFFKESRNFYRSNVANCGISASRDKFDKKRIDRLERRGVS